MNNKENAPSHSTRRRNDEDDEALDPKLGTTAEAAEKTLELEEPLAAANAAAASWLMA